MSRTPEYGSDVVVDLMVDLGIDYVSFNPGATFRGLHDSIVNYAGSDIEFIECLHEEISVALAHGYAKAAGKPMAAAVHDVVGLQHASMAIYNAWMDQVPMLVLGATGPVDATKRRPWTDWIHTALVQGTQVRDYTKWDDQPGSIAAVPETIIRAVQITNTAPRGPVYVCLDHEIQEDPIPEGFANLDVADFAAPVDAAPDPEAVERVVDWLVDASSPVVLADMVGRSQAGLELLVELADALALPVVDRERNYNKVSMNFPTAHPLNASGDPDALVGVDVVLALEMRDLSGVLGRTGAPTVRGRGQQAELAAGAKVVNVTMASYVGGSWISEMQRLHAADLQLLVESEPFLRALLPRVKARLADAGGDLRDRVEGRRRLVSERSAAQRKQWRQEAEARREDKPISKELLALTIGDATAGDDRIVSNGSLGNWIHRLWDLDRADQYLGDSGGAGLGYGLGATLGTALAHRGTDRLVIDIQSDGDALYTPSALWTAAHHRLPALIVMDNNRGYNNSVEHAERIARNRTRPAERRGLGTAIDDPEVDFAALARSFGVHGEGPVTEPSELRPAIDRALEVVRDQRLPAVVDVITGLAPFEA